MRNALLSGFRRLRAHPLALLALLLASRASFAQCAAPPYVAVTNASPYTQTFETAWQSLCGTNDAPGANWMNTPATGNTSWRRDDDGISAAWTSPTAGVYTPAGSPLSGGSSLHSARFHAYYVTGRGVGTLDLYANLSNGTGTPTLTFDYINTSGTDSVKVQLSTNGGSTFTTIAGSGAGVSSTWTRRTVNLPTTGLTATSVVRLRAVGDFGNTDIGIDNVQLAFVTCPAVTGAAISGITATGATLSFTPSAGSANYTITATPASGTPITQTATTSPVTLASLTPSTVYTVSIVSNCGTANGSSQPAVVTFQSGCVAPPYVAVTSTTSYTQDFETAWLSQCATNDAPGATWLNTPATGNASWRRNDDGASAGWTGPTVGAYTPTGSSGTYSARFHSYYAGANNIGTLDLYANLSAAGNKVLQFDYLNTAGNDSLQIQVSTDGGTTFGAPLLRLGISGTVAQGWQPQNVSITSTSATTVIRFRGKVTGTFTSDIGFDNLRLGILSGVPGCATNLSPANGATGVVRSPTITFSSGSGVTTGYDVYFGTSATPPLVSSNQPGQSYMPAGLATTTTYYYQIVPRNANGPATGCSVSSFTTTSTLVYCNTNLGNTCGTADITNVTVGGSGLNNSSTTCNSSNGSAYTSYPATGTATGTLLQGLSYPVSVTTAAAGIISVWIDFNQNGTFEASEWTQVTTTSTANQPATVNVLVPATALLGPTGLRIRSRSSGSPNGAGDACTTFFSGETEDYIVTIGAAPSCAPPTSLGASNLSTTSATLTYGAGSGTATSYVVQYGPAGFNPALPSSGTNAYTTVNTTSLSAAISGLTANTSYQFYVTKNCGAGQTSQTAGPFTFTTLCLPPVYATLPYSQDFENTWVNGCNTRDIPSTNWLNTPVTGNTSWRRDDDGASAAWTGPSFGAYTPAGSPLSGGTSLHAARFHSDYVQNRGVGTLDLYANLSSGTGTGTPTLTFDYINTSGTDSVRVQLSTNGGSTFTTLAGSGAGISSTWTRRTVNLPATGLTATCVVRLRAVGDFGATDIGIDNVQLAFVTCPAATGLSITSTSATSVNFNFTPVTGAASYTLTLTPAGGGTPTTQTVTSSPVALTGLTPGATYTASLVSSCGGSGTSQPAVLTFAVPAGNDECAGAVNVPVQFGTACVSQTSADNTTATTSTGPTPSCTSTLNRDIWFKVTVPASGVVTVKTVAPTGGSNITDTVISLYSGTCGNLAEIGCNDDTNGLYSQVALTGRTPGEVLYVRAWAYSSTSSGLIAVCATTPSNCPAPLSPTATNLTNTTAQLNWVAPANAPAGATYEIEYGPQGFTLGNGTTVTGLTGSTYQLTSLTPNSDYCYYVRLNCGATNGSSTYVGPTCFTTPLTVPANDNPCGAITLGATAVNGSTAGATTSAQAGIPLPTCSSAQLPKDVWFAFTATAATYRLTVTGTAAGLVRVFTSPDCAAGPFNQIGCFAGPGANQNVGPVDLSGLTVGTRYYVAVSGYSSSDTPGNFTILAATVTATKAQADTDALLVYPNPSNTGQLTLRLGNVTKAGQVTLLNALGQVVATRNLSATAEQTLSTRGLATGVYTLRVTVAGQVLTRKVVLE